MTKAPFTIGARLLATLRSKDRANKIFYRTWSWRAFTDATGVVKQKRLRTTVVRSRRICSSEWTNVCKGVLHEWLRSGDATPLNNLIGCMVVRADAWLDESGRANVHHYKYRQKLGSLSESRWMQKQRRWRPRRWAKPTSKKVKGKRNFADEALDIMNLTALSSNIYQ